MLTMNTLSLKSKLTTGFLSLFFCVSIQAQSTESTVSQDSKISELLVLKTKLTKNNELSDRYKIQLFSGEREGAYSTLKDYKNGEGTWSSSIKYQTPNYKVWIGNFRNRLEADRALLKIKKEFNSAFIFKPDRG